MHVRIPGWALGKPVPGDLYRYADSSKERPMVTLNGKSLPLDTHHGYLVLNRRWKRGDKIRLTLPLPVRRVLAHDSVEANHGRVALERGPFVYCAEWIDQPDSAVFNSFLPHSATLNATLHSDTLGEVYVIRGNAGGSRVDPGSRAKTTFVKDIVAIPYYFWSHRGPGEMTVWLPRDNTYAQPTGSSPLSTGSAVSASGGENTAVVHDERVPTGTPSDSSQYYRSNAADTVWVQYHFQSPQEVSGVDVYWVDDGATVTVPSSWRVLLRYDGKWHAAHTPNKKWGTEKNQPNRVIFEAFRTDTLRLEAVTNGRTPVGIAEWKVF
jgi:hypothetical protein